MRKGKFVLAPEFCIWGAALAENREDNVEDTAATACHAGNRGGKANHA